MIKASDRFMENADSRWLRQNGPQLARPIILAVLLFALGRRLRPTPILVLGGVPATRASVNTTELYISLRISEPILYCC
jgi:hypothetical protein